MHILQDWEKVNLPERHENSRSDERIILIDGRRHFLENPWKQRQNFMTLAHLHHPTGESSQQR
jgi:hypothetical protein